VGLTNFAPDPFWGQVALVKVAALRLHNALEQRIRRHVRQGEPVPDVLLDTQEQVRAVSNVIQERLSLHERILPSNLKLDMDRSVANGLMEVLPQKWEAAEKLLASIEDAGVVSAWDAVKREVESLSDSWGKAKEIKEQG